MEKKKVFCKFLNTKIVNNNIAVISIWIVYTEQQKSKSRISKFY